MYFIVFKWFISRFRNILSIDMTRVVEGQPNLKGVADFLILMDQNKKTLGSIL